MKSNKLRLMCLVHLHCFWKLVMISMYMYKVICHTVLRIQNRQLKIDNKQNWRHYLLFWLVRPHGIPSWTHPILCLLERPTNVLNYWLKEHDERSSPHNYLYKKKLLISLIRTQVKSKITFKSFFSLDHHLILRFKTSNLNFMW